MVKPRLFKSEITKRWYVEADHGRAGQRILGHSFHFTVACHIAKQYWENKNV